MKNSFSVDIVIPVYNEAKSIPLLVEQLRVLPYPSITIMFVDDGSTDDTLSVLRHLAAAHDNVVYLSFSRNFGHQTALKAGLDHSTADCTITMDGDLQHPPSLIPIMIECWRSGADVVHTRRKSTAAPGLLKKYSSKAFYRVLNACIETPIEPGTADFRLLDKKIVLLCQSLREDTFFWRGLIPWFGFRQEYIDYDPGMRQHGKSKYTLKRMVRLAWEGISSFSLLPLRFATILGMCALFGNIIYAIYILWQFVKGETVTGWSSLMLITIGTSAIHMIFLGIIGEYLGKIFLSCKGRPTYILKETRLSDKK